MILKNGFPNVNADSDTDAAFGVSTSLPWIPVISGIIIYLQYEKRIIIKNHYKTSVGIYGHRI